MATLTQAYHYALTTATAMGILSFMETKLVRTKSGNKLHLATAGSSRTMCGHRYAMHVRALAPGSNVEGCQQCGMPPGTTAAELIERYLTRS